MPFMRGMMPLRRTLFFLRQGKIKFRDEVKIFIISYHHKPNPAQQGTKDFIFWHWAQMIFKNPQIQFLKYDKMSVNPFALAFLRDGREVPFDLEWKTPEEIEQMLLSTLGNTALVQKRDHMMTLLKNNPADFGINCKRQCICEVQGQHPCTSLLTAPKYCQGSWRWDHASYKERPTYPANKHLAEIADANVDRDHPDFYP